MENEKYRLINGDLLVARTGATFGKTMLFNHDITAIYASYLIRIRFKKTEIKPEYYWVFAQSQSYWDQAKKLMTGGGQPQFNGNALKEIMFQLPLFITQIKIIERVDSERNIVEGCRQLINQYEAKIKACIDRVWGE